MPPLYKYATAATTAAALLLSGCGGLSPNAAPTAAPVTLGAFQGRVFGGQQPIAGANVVLYAAATTGYAAAAANLMQRTVLSDATGSFTATGAYTCTAGQQVYIVATGGDPGGGVNPNSALMAALGECSTLSAATIVNINEVTTVATAFALAPFMSSIQNAGASATNTSGLAHAFASAGKLVTNATGLAPGSALPADAVAPTAALYSLANLLATCINSTGGLAGSNTNCGPLFSLATPPSGTAPADTIQAALNIAHNPANNAGPLFKLITPQSPFGPSLAAAPTDWTLAITYKAAGTLNAPHSTTVDAAGRIWIANSGNNTLTVLTQTGQPAFAPLTGNGLATPSALAIDTAGNAWAANSAGTSVSAFTPAGATYGASPFTGAATLSAPSSLAFDPSGNLWIANPGNNTVTQLSSSGAFLQNVSTGATSPASIAINPR